jgi:tRNA modification GTPase
MRTDTIVAIATAPGEGGIGIVRLSGAEAAEIAGRLFHGRLRDRCAVFGRIVDPRSGEQVDEALGLLMRAPRTYTREDTAELQAHGGPVVLRRIVELCLREGARQAEPGEFTLRAFLNGRLDLAQAEAVLDVIQARTDDSLRLALKGLSGQLTARLRPLRASLLDLLAYLSARADFPDEDVPAADIAPAIRSAADELARLLDTADSGMVYRQGLRVAIVGRPNVGKSSLLNRLLGEDRAIVTPIAGTTRDTVEEMANLADVPVILIDTAGLNETDDEVERIGVDRARDALARSDAVLVVLDATRVPGAEELDLLQRTGNRPRVVALNKTDLTTPSDRESDVLDGASAGPTPSHVIRAPVVPRSETAPRSQAADVRLAVAGVEPIRVSALTGAGVEELASALAELVTHGGASAAETPTVANPRHKAALERALVACAGALGGLESGLPEDLVAVDLRDAAGALGEITGETVTEDLLDSIFRNFCIGK